MATRQHRKSILAPLLVPVIAISFLAYFAWHAWHGAFGVEARRQLDMTADRLRLELSGLAQEKTILERRVRLLQPQGLESDMLDERGREILGFADSNEIAIYARSAGTPVMTMPQIKPVIVK